MLDSLMRRLIDPPLKRVAGIFPVWFSANMMTLVGFGFGVLSFFALVFETPLIALIFLLVNRLADGLDGALARRDSLVDRSSDLGGYLDIVCDFLIWALLPLGFIALDSDNSVSAAILLSSFSVSMTVFLAFAVMASKRNLSSVSQGRKNFFYLSGLAEGTETILFFVLVMLFPRLFVPSAIIFSIFVYLSSFSRILVSWRILRSSA